MLVAEIVFIILFPVYGGYTEFGFGLGFFHTQHFPVVKRSRPHKADR